MRKLAILLVSVYLLSMAVTAVASAESGWQKVYDDIQSWSWSSKKDK